MKGKTQTILELCIQISEAFSVTDGIQQISVVQHTKNYDRALY